jgi:Mg/Co/Ni transporter MgtE
VDQQARLIGTVPLARLVLAKSDEKLSTQAQEPLVFVHAGASEKQVAEIFDKYNLLTLPVLDAEGKLTGVITSDDVISLLRAKL